MFIVFFQHTK